VNFADIELARAWADLYRRRGLKPLPSRPDAKRPCCTFRELWEAPLPEDLLDRHPTTNLQVMTGRKQTTASWGLIVIDLDGPDAPGVLSTWGALPRTWVSRSGDNGSHLWLRVSRLGPPLPKGFLWRGEGKHSGIERLGDRSLAMAPPSIHPKTGNRYRWLAGQSPRELPLPAFAPAWLLARPLVATDNQPARRGPSCREVLEHLPHKAELAKSWGLRLASSRPNAGGWLYCHALDREDRHPSAAFNVHTGRYVDFGTGLRLGLVDLGIALGRFRDASEAISHLKGY
jgi:hypothetical protein